MNVQEYRVLAAKQKVKPRRKAKVVLTESEQSLQEATATYFSNILIPGVSEYEGHESSIGLGVYPPKPTDSPVTQQCKKFYNRFVMAAQRKLQAKGVKKGSHDGYIFYSHAATKVPSVLCLEFKVGYNKGQAEQLATHSRFKSMGFPTVIPKNIEDVKAALILYGVPNREVVIK